ncbi:MAG: hypothetical protein GXC70_00370, partial [Sphingomonadaceae bacterium]|nr:hypothetical protein [Sphingomonadaceae bacterium]
MVSAFPWSARCWRDSAGSDRARAMSTQALPIKVAALYRFTPLDGLPELRAQLLDLCRAEGIRGTLLLAREGINGTIAGPDTALDRVV